MFNHKRDTLIATAGQPTTEGLVYTQQMLTDIAKDNDIFYVDDDKLYMRNTIPLGKLTSLVREMDGTISFTIRINGKPDNS